MPNELVKQISYVLYKADEEDVKVNAFLKDESIWLIQKAMAELFDCSKARFANVSLVIAAYFMALTVVWIKINLCLLLMMFAVTL